MWFKIFKILFILLIIFATINCDKKSTKEQTIETSAEKIQWVDNLVDGFKLAKEKNKPLMVDFYADWCYWCKRLDSDVYTNSEVIKLSKDFVCVKVDTDKYPAEAKRYKVSGLPTIIFFNPEGEIIERIIGYRNSKDFINKMSEVLKR